MVKYSFADQGWRRSVADAGGRVADIERRWSDIVGERNFAHLTRTMRRLLDELDPNNPLA
jgi:hypothetical protein